jgi:uncharacterized protein
VADDESGERGRGWRAWAQLLTGLTGFSLSIVLMIESRLGLGPWDAFHVGVSKQTGLSIGTASIATGLVIVAVVWATGIRPGPATVASMFVIGWEIDLLLPVVPTAPGTIWAYAYYLAGIALCGVATGFYIAARLGEGPRDGLILGVSARTGRSVTLVRTVIELSVLLAGWLMGGAVGVGTIIFALGIGPAMQWGMRLCGVEHHPRPPSDEP